MHTNIFRAITCIFLSQLIAFTAIGQDKIQWNKNQEDSKIADTVSLQDYLPVKDGKIYYEVVRELTGISQNDIFMKALLAVQGGGLTGAIYDPNFDQKGGVCSVGMTYNIAQTSLLSALGSNPTTNSYFFNTILSVIAKDGKYKIKIEVPDYKFESLSKFSSYADQAKTKGMPMQELANSKKAFKKQRINALKALNEKMLEDFNYMYSAMQKVVDNKF